jgi:hypothetical protein
MDEKPFHRAKSIVLRRIEGVDFNDTVASGVVPGF